MSARLILSAAIALGLSPLAHAETAASGQQAVIANPLLQASTLEFQFPHFDQLKDEHYAPAIEQGMREQLAEVEAIADQKDAPTFENTIVALEKTGTLYNRATTVFFNLAGTVTNDAMNKVRADVAPKLAAHLDAILLNDALFQRVKSLYERKDDLKLDAESERLLWRYHTDFVRAGARLDAAQKASLTKLNAEIATLQTTFTQNVLDETNASAIYVEDRKQLDGLSDNAIAAAEAAARAAGKDKGYLIALMNTSGQPATTSLKDRALRLKLQQTSEQRAAKGGKYDNRDIALKLAKLRAERAQLLGYADFATYVLEDQTAKTTAAVNKMMADLAPAAVANAKKEAAEIQKIIDAEHAGAKDGGFQLAAADWSHYSEKVRAEKFAFDQAQLRPYFEIDQVLEDGIFFAANKLYGLSFKERHDLPKYHPTLRTFDVFDADGSKLAILISDMYARPAKRGGAWMNSYVSQSHLLDRKPVVAMHLNVPEPPKGEPTLLTWDEANTAFHEFGHVLHGMFSNVKYPRFSGTAVPRDFVEYPSQVNEMWMTDPAVLANYAKHYQTGEAMPKALLDKVLATGTFNQGFATTEYLGAAMLDQAWHQLKPDQVPKDAIQFEQDTLKKIGVDFAPVPPRYRSTYFNHIFSGGYAAGYYAYLWSEVLDADSVEWFEEQGGLKRENGDHFRKTLLSKGGSVDAMQLFRDFRGRDPRIEPLLVRRGLK
ncbi:MAG TPA: M3 family metallopeptidase [Patescibacteria group bacterium]|nr:M3 family metallopeptidase [Patescibacteria group bacterium]